MKLLLNGNLPKRLKTDFLNHEVYTVREKGWNGIQNGELIKLIINKGLHALLTFDKNLQHQQNFQKYPITVFVLSAVNNTYLELTKLSPLIHIYLNELPLNSGSILIAQPLNK
ncbi:MAG: hypothetical protein V4717_01375 [Bacteroidota bacterium]